MATKKLDAGELDLDADLNLDEFDFEMGNNPDLKNKKSRNPILSVATGVGKGVADKFKSPSFLAKVTEDALPSEYGEITKTANKIVGTATSLYDDAIREIKPSAARLASKVDKLIPAEQTRLKKLSTAISEKLGNKRSDYEDNSANQAEQQIALQLGSVFGLQQVNDEKFRARENAQRSIDRSIEGKRFKGTFSVLSSIDENMSKTAAYTTTVTNAYQKKSLELQFRSYFAQAEQLQLLKDSLAKMDEQNQAIIKNTALPEYAKINESERFKELAKNKAYDGIRKSIFGDGEYIQLAANRLKAQAKDFISGVKMGLEQSASIADELGGLSELEKELEASGMGSLDKKEMLGAMAGGSLGNKMGKHISKFFKSKVNTQGRLYKDLQKGAGYASNLPGAMKDLANSDFVQQNQYEPGFKSWLAKGAKWGADLFRPESIDTSISESRKLGSLNETSVTGFDNRAAVTLNEIIPGYLARIQREIIISRTGDANTPLVMFDHTKGRFTNANTLASDLRGRIKKSIQDSGYGDRVKAYAKHFSKESGLELDDEDNKRMAELISKLSELNISHNPENIRKTNLYKDLDPKTKANLDTILDNFIDKSEDKEKNQTTFQKAIMNVRHSTPDIKGEIQAYVDAGYGELLEGQGVIKFNGKGGYSIEDEDKYMDMIRKDSMITSDINAKEGISKFSPKGVLDKVKKTKMYNWFYRHGRGDDEQHTGPMAQDINKNFGEDAAPGGTKIDLATQNGYNMAAIQELDKKLEDRTVGDKTSNLLALIGKDTTTIVKLLKSSSRGKGKSQAGYGYGHDGSYKGMAGSMLSSGYDMANRAAKDSFSAAQAMFTAGKDKIAKPLLANLSKLYQNTKGPAAESFSFMMKKATDLAGSALELGKKTITEHLPAGLKWVGDAAATVKKKFTEALNAPMDLYLAGMSVPVIRANLLKAGEYYDQASGQVIKNLSDIKGTVVDKLGNVVLTKEDYFKGLYDKLGKAVNLDFKSIGGTAIGLAVTGFNKIKDLASEGFAKLSKFGSGGFDKLKEKFKGKQFNLPSIDVFQSRSYNALIQIRNILMRNMEGIPVELDEGMSKTGINVNVDKIKDNATKLADKVKTKLASMSGSVGERLSSAKEKIKGYAKDEDGNSRFSMPDLSAKYKSAGSILGSLKDKATGLFNNPEKSDDFVGPRKPNILTTVATKAGSLKGMGGGLKGKIGGLLGMFGGGQSSENEERTEPQLTDQQKRAKSEQPTSKSEPGKIDWSAPKGKMSPVKYNDSDGDGDRDGNAKDRLAEMEKRKAANKKDPLKADLDPRYKSDQNIIDVMMKKVTGLFSFMQGGVGDLVSSGMDLFGKGGLGKLVRGAGGKLLSAGKGLFNIGKGVVSGIGSIGRGVLSVGRLLPGAAKVGRGLMMARNAATIAGLATGGTLSALGGIASAALTAMASPVVIGAVAAAAVGYAGYKLYKYMTRNNTDEFSDIRIKQYGLTNTDKDRNFNSPVLGLENYLEDGRITYNGGKPDINTRKIDMEEILSMFSIDKGDSDGVTNFTAWFNKRFKPFYLTHLAALFSVNNKVKLANINTLKPEEKLKYLGMVSYDSGPYDEDVSPFKGLDSLNVDPEIVKTAIDKLLTKLKEETFKEGKKEKDSEIGAKPKSPINKQPEKKLGSDVYQSQKNSFSAIDPKNPFGSGEEGKAPSGAGSSGSFNRSVSPGKVVAAGGAMRDGSEANQYIKLANGVSLDGIKPEMLANLKGMIQEFGEATGESVVVTSGSRTREQQERLYRENPNKAAKPGKSLHEFGLAIDMDSKTLEKMEQMGLMRKYGFTRPVGGEPWHVEPAGIQVNIPLAKQDGNFAAQAIQSSLNKGGGGAGTNSSVPLGKRDPQLAMQTMGVDAAAPSNTYSKSEVGDKVPNLDPNAGTKTASYSGSTTVANPSNKAEVKQAIADNAKRAGADPETVETFAAIESGLNPNAKSKSSNAAGLYGFMPATWNEQIKKNGSKYGLSSSASPNDVEASTLMASEYIKSNEKAISSVVSNPGVADIYTAHFLGANGAKKLLSADPNTNAAQLLPNAASVNKSIFYKDGYPRTTGEIQKVLASKVENKAKEFGIALDPSEISSKATGMTYSDTTGKTLSSSGNPSMAAKNAPNESGTAANDPQIKKEKKGIFSSMLDPFSSSKATKPDNNFDSKGVIASISTSNESLGKLVVIQSEMLNVMKSIYSAIDPEKLKAAQNGKVENTESKRSGPSKLPEPALNLSRGS